MFVRWQSRKRAERNKWALRHVGDITWNAILVESVRVDGKPQQKHVAYLGSFSTRQAASQPQRVYTWEAMLERLDRLSNRIPPKARKNIEAAIALKLGPAPICGDQKMTSDHWPAGPNRSPSHGASPAASS
jgi:hypothetical protein